MSEIEPTKARRLAVAAGKLGPLMRIAEREGWAEWVKTPADERAVLHGCKFDAEAAEKVCRFFPMFLRHSISPWAGQPFELADWQKHDLIYPIFGWKKADGYRRIRKAHVEVGKKNGKSTFASGLGIYLLLGDGEIGAHVYSAATKRDQAAIVHREAINMVNKSPELLSRLKVNASTGRISYPRTESFYETLAYEPGGSEGLKIHGLIADELHAWKGRLFWDTLRYGGAARKQPVRLVITTAGVLDRTTIGWDQHEYAIQWLENRIEDDEFYAYVRAADLEDDILDPATHAKANPSYGITFDKDEIANEAKVASERLSERQNFLRYRLNIWSESLDQFFDMAAWDKCDGEVDEVSLIGRECYGGLDLASKKDLTAWVILFVPSDDDPFYRVVARFWCPRTGAERRSEEDRVPYLEWHRGGWLTLTEGDRTDYAVVRDQIIQDVNLFGIADAAADPYQFEFLRQQILDAVPQCTFYEFSQQMRTISEPTKALEALVADGRLAHGGHPVLRWNAANSTPREDNLENVRIDKKKSSDKIDGIIALIMAFARSRGEKTAESQYETEEPVVL